MIRGIAALVSLSASLSAQTSALAGFVTDPQGTVVAVATVSAVNRETAKTRRTVTGDDGSYHFRELPPGPYVVEIQSPRFRTSIQQVRLHGSSPVTLNAKLETGAVVETVHGSGQGVVSTQQCEDDRPLQSRTGPSDSNRGTKSEETDRSTVAPRPRSAR